MSSQTRAFSIIRADLTHVDLIAPLFDAYRVFYNQVSDLERAYKYVRARLKQKHSVIFLALDDDGNALGFTLMYPTFSSIAMQSMWIVNDLYVKEDMRRHGVAEALLLRARQHALDTGARGLQLETAVNNFAAQKLYEKLGWKRETEFYTYNLRVE
jgi:ribosomal protein S18 acetylase RimI-like enzyme